MPASSKKRSTSRRSRSTTSRSAGRRTSRSGTDAIALLKQDHQKVRGLLKRFESNPSEDLLDQIDTELKIHTQIEEEIFYPAYRDAVEGNDEQEKLYYEALEEHHVVDLVLPEIKATAESSEEFEAKGKVLKDLVEHHAEEEEKNMFPKARKAMGAAELRNLGMRLKERKQELMEGGSVMGKFTRMMGSRRRAA
ncbi:MAG TPA: hemerythrin domain-containing protein [Terriglobia bacterium]|nr:hemerythrin domain-containing protein [Terriglobia bacterium]